VIAPGFDGAETAPPERPENSPVPWGLGEAVADEEPLAATDDVPF